MYFKRRGGGRPARRSWIRLCHRRKPRPKCTILSHVVMYNCRRYSYICGLMTVDVYIYTRANFSGLGWTSARSFVCLSVRTWSRRRSTEDGQMTHLKWHVNILHVASYVHKDKYTVKHIDACILQLILSTPPAAPLT